MTAPAGNLKELPNPLAALMDVTSDLDLTIEQLAHALRLSGEIKRTPGRFTKALSGKYVSLLFEKPSLRTRLTFEIAMKQLGGDAVISVGIIGDREPVKDVARNLDRWTQGIVARVYSQSTIDELARWSQVPVINALSDLYHPCQALADMLTIQEQLGDFAGRKLAFVGDGNNVAHSLMLMGTRLGMSISVATPKGYEPKAEIVECARQFGEVTVTNNAAEAVAGADAVYTDVWTSMGQEKEAAERKRIFAPFQVNDALLAESRQNAIFMHCLPAKRGEEVTDSVMESPQSVVFDQAENRLHVQKALLVMLLG